MPPDAFPADPDPDAVPGPNPVPPDGPNPDPDPDAVPVPDAVLGPNRVPPDGPNPDPDVVPGPNPVPPDGPNPDPDPDPDADADAVSGPNRDPDAVPGPNPVRSVPLSPSVPALDRARAVQWFRKWRWYTRPQRPWNRARLQVELARREAFARGRLNGDVLTMLRDGRLTVGPQVFLEPGVWLTAGDHGRIVLGEGTFLNQGVMVAAEQLVEIGAHCMAANGCLITDGSHRFDDPEMPVPWQGFTTKGPTRIGDNVWLGANVVVTSGVTIGERCVIGANSVVTRDIPPFSIAAGAPARVIAPVAYPERSP